MPTHPIAINTLGVCIDDGYRIAMHCDEGGMSPCHFFKWLDLERLAAKLGRDHGSMHNDLVPHLYCLKCGSRRVSLRLHAPDGNDARGEPERERIRQVIWTNR